MEDLTASLLTKYNTHGPRYTSYPTAPVWTDAFGPADFQAALEATNPPDNTDPLSLYTHLPFCESRCLFCGCNVVITQQRDQAEKYLGYLFQDIEAVARRMAPGRPVTQYHWGGGTPTYLSPEQMERLFRFHQEHFAFAPDAEIAIEVDPRVTTSEQLATLRALGFNRISLGVQDFHPPVQEAIHRIQPVEMTAAMVAECRRLGFEGLNLDLIYGLPHQTADTFAHTLEEVIRLSPDRLALYNYAHVPWMSPHQQQIPEAALPETAEKFRIFQTAIEHLTAAGYIYIGMDHFAKPEDELSRALAEGRLHRNFMGYTVQKSAGDQPFGKMPDLYGFGVSAISCLDGHYAQNQRKLSTYYEAVTAGRLPTLRGLALTAEDLLRRQVILNILCQGAVDYRDFETAFDVDFPRHFADALAALQGPTADGLLTWHDHGFQVTPLGRVFSRNLAMPFDAYLPQQSQGEKPLFSRTL